MALTEHYYTIFEDCKLYHVYNRSVDRKTMFFNEDNYKYFLTQYDKYLSSVVDTYAYCLLGNHFHFLVRIHDITNELATDSTDLTTFQKLSNLTIPHIKMPENKTHYIVSHQFQKFFQSYAMAFNKQRNRSGTLFQTPFKRALVDEDTYFNHMVCYIHCNPEYHGLNGDFKQWKWSSYNKMLTDRASQLKKQEILNLFGGKQQYLDAHFEKHQRLKNDNIFLEDDE